MRRRPRQAVPCRAPRCDAKQGQTLSAAITALIASETELTEAVAEALSYLDRSLDGGFRPGMGNVIPDRLFWAQPEDDEEEEAQESSFEISPNDTRH